VIVGWKNEPLPRPTYGSRITRPSDFKNDDSRASRRRGSQGRVRISTHGARRTLSAAKTHESRDNPSAFVDVELH
jgi:hypothetical protein